MRFLKFKRGPDVATDPDLLARLGAIASRGREEGSLYLTPEVPSAPLAVQRVFSTPKEIAAEHGRE